MRRKRKNLKEWAAKRKKVGSIQQKILLLLLGGVALSCARTLGEQWKIITEMGEEWRDIKRQRVERAIAALYQSQLIDSHRNADGTHTLVLCEDGKKQALTYNLGNMCIIPPQKWDEMWRIVIFDIPEEMRAVRDSLRTRLIHLGFHELQRSVLVHPFECGKEIKFLTELYNLRPHLRIILAIHIDNEAHLKKIFCLS